MPEKNKLVKNESISYIVISKSQRETKSVIEVLDEIKLSKHKYTKRIKYFREISKHIPSQNNSDILKKTYVFESESIIIIKEFNPNYFYSKRYLEQLVVNFPKSTIAYYLRSKDFSNHYGDELKLIKKSNPKVWIRSFGEGKQVTDFASSYFSSNDIKISSVENKAEIYLSIQNILDNEFQLDNLENLQFEEIKRLSLNELLDIGFLEQNEIEAIDNSFGALSENPIYSGYGWGNNIPQNVRDEQMPSIKELSSQILTLIIKLLRNENYKYLKSKKSLNLKTNKGENIISLGTNGYGVSSKFNILFTKRINEIAKILNEHFYQNKINTINNFKNYRTVSESFGNIFLGEIIAISVNSLISQIISACRFINKYVLDELDKFESIKYLDETLNKNNSILSLNYFSNKFPFSRRTDSSINEITLGIMNQNSDVDVLISNYLNHMSNKEIISELISNLKTKYGT